MCKTQCKTVQLRGLRVWEHNYWQNNKCTCTAKHLPHHAHGIVIIAGQGSVSFNMFNHDLIGQTVGGRNSAEHVLGSILDLQNVILF